MRESTKSREGNEMEAKETKQMAGMEMGEACCRTERTPAEQKKLLTRLKTVEGQIRGIQKWWKLTHTALISSCRYRLYPMR